MNAERWQRLDRIFAEARELPAARRTAFVTDACGEDQGLRDEALSLLQADDASGEFMSRPALDRLAHAVAADGWGLKPGERIGAYTILRMLGSGGAGEVWCARDERLSRDVAIKVLLPHLSADADRLRRFAEEVRAVGAINHSNILTVYDVGEHNGMPFLVTECLEGKNLRERLDEGVIPTGEAVAIALKITRGLAAAHGRGIVHRDLKPENVFLRTDRDVKVLDFGLAKLQQAFEGIPAKPNETATGAIIGTAAYMAPEQVRGEQVDGRADLFALGVMLYEMLSGKHPFRGASTFETLHAILTADPPDLVTVNEKVPPRVARIVTRLMQKDRAARFQSALDLGWSLEEAASGADVFTRGDGRARKAARRSLWTAWIPAGLLTTAILGAAWWLFRDSRSDLRPAEITQFTWTLPTGMVLDSPPVISPNSRHIAFVGKDSSGSRLFVRDLGSLDPRMVPGSDGAMQPFWSPDSKALGFFAGGRLMTVPWPNGAPAVVASAFAARGGTWSSSGTILIAPDVILAGLSRVAAGGAGVEPVTFVDTARGDASHWWPVFLPDGAHFLYFLRSTDGLRTGLYLGGIDQPAAGRLLLPMISNAALAPLPGTAESALFYVVDNRVEVRRFDTARLRIGGDARAIGFSAGGSTLYHPAMLSASAEVLAFAPAAVPAGNRLEAVSRTGERMRIWQKPESQNWPRISPDGGRLARQHVDRLRNNPDIWVEDLERGTRVRVTMAVEPDIQPVWAPDGRHLAYVTGNLPGREGAARILNVAAADGTGIVDSFPCPGEYCEPTDWSPDGRHLLVNVVGPATMDVWVVALEKDAATHPLLDGVFVERDARFSPDGRWVAYVTEESGRPEVSVRTVSGPPQRIAVSADGGAQPVWRRDGRELFFVDLTGNLRSVPVNWQEDGAPAIGVAAELKVPPIGFGHWGTQYDVSPDGSRIYFLRRNEDPAPREIHVVMGWNALLE